MKLSRGGLIGSESSMFMFSVAFLVLECFIVGASSPVYAAGINGYISGATNFGVPNFTNSGACAWWQVGILCSVNSVQQALQNVVTTIIYYFVLVFTLAFLPFTIYGYVTGVLASYSIYLVIPNAIAMLMILYSVGHSFL